MRRRNVNPHCSLHSQRMLDIVLDTEPSTTQLIETGLHDSSVGWSLTQHLGGFFLPKGINRFDRMNAIQMAYCCWIQELLKHR